MKRYFIPASLLLLMACNDAGPQADKQANADTVARTTKPAAPQVTALAADKPVLSERIDGPANIRDESGKKIIFSLDNDVPVTARAAEDGYMEIGVCFDISKPDANQVITKGTTLYRDGKVIGKVLEDIDLYQTFQIRNKKYGVINGFTAVNNIQSATILENAFLALAGNNRQLTMEQMKPLLTSYQFTDFEALVQGGKGFMYYDSELLDPTAAPRFWPVFKNDSLVAIFHSRKMDMPGIRTEEVPNGFMKVFSTDEKAIKDLKKKYIKFCQSAG